MNNVEQFIAALYFFLFCLCLLGIVGLCSYFVLRLRMLEFVKKYHFRGLIDVYWEFVFVNDRDSFVNDRDSFRSFTARHVLGYLFPLSLLDRIVSGITCMNPSVIKRISIKKREYALLAQEVEKRIRTGMYPGLVKNTVHYRDQKKLTNCHHHDFVYIGANKKKLYATVHYKEKEYYIHFYSNS